MKILKKYGIYVVLVLATATLGSVGYITESQKEARKEKSAEEIKYIPKEITIKAEKPEIVETVNEIVGESEKPKPVPQKKAETIVYTKPVTGEPSVEYSGDKMIFSETMDDFRVHQGQDYPCNSGEEILAAANGVVTDIYDDDFFGLCLNIEHGDGTLTKYCALSEARVNAGDSVKGGTAVAIAGNSAKCESAQGVHLHFEAIKDGKNINPKTLFN